MEHWKRIIELANGYFSRGEYIDAREHYLQALALSRVLFERWHDADEAVAAYVISHHNLADVHLRLKQPEESAEYLCAIHEHLLQCLVDPRMTEELRHACLRHSRHSYVELIQFTTAHGDTPRIRRVLRRSANQPASMLQQQALLHEGPSHGVH